MAFIARTKQAVGHPVTKADIDQSVDNENDLNARIKPFSGENLLVNGGFESGLASWKFTDGPSGSHAIETALANVYEGTQSLKVVQGSSGASNAGCELLYPDDGDSLIPINPASFYALTFSLYCSAANLSTQAEILWYKSDLSYISASTLHLDSTTNPTSWARLSTFRGAAPPSDARNAAIKISVGVAGGNAGTFYIDDIRLTARRNNVYNYASGSGTAGTANTAMTVKGDTLPSFVSALGDRVVINALFKANNSVPTIAYVKVGTPGSETTVSAINISDSNVHLITSEITYVDNTHANVKTSHDGAHTFSVNLSGFDWDSPSNYIVYQPAVSTSLLTVYEFMIDLYRVGE
jgi:hypothetical protein